MLTALRKSTPPNDQEKLNWLRLSRTENVGPITFYQLIERFGSAEKALNALPELAARGGRKKPLKAPEAGIAEKEYAQLRKLGGDMIAVMEDGYPLALSAIDDAPPLLSYIGNLKLAHQSCVAIVGARNASINGKKFAQKLGADLGAKNQIVVSGLARGIDTAAHQGALKTGTVAVVATGLDVVYPEENQTLYKEICENGLVLAEGALGQAPFAAAFPRRNRIVSGLSKGVVVVEATRKSGSLITARLAGEQGRDVYAVPGHPLDPRAEGPNHLIREGATLVRSADDIIEMIETYSGTGFADQNLRQSALGTMQASQESVPDNAHDLVTSQLSFTPISVDELIRSCQLSIPVLQTVLLELELAGRISRLPGNRVMLVNEGP